jgi:hypothetical protein
MTDQPHRAIHYLKCWPQFFEAVARGLKPFEVRKNDRDFRVADQVVMYEWDPLKSTEREAEGYTGREVRGNILSVVEASDSSCLKGVIAPDYVVLGIEWTDGLYPKVGA